ncbi:Phosphatidylglycerol/phosphatidylinositol transfer protein [Rhizina undulata]
MKLLLQLPVLSVLVLSASASNLFQQLAGKEQPLLPLGVKVPGESPLEHCDGDKYDILTIEKVNLTPNPPVPGQKLIIEAHGILNDAIEKGALVEVTVKYHLITLIKERLDLCDHVSEVGLECPIDEGKMVLTKEVTLPKAIPPGKYSVIANAYTEDGRPITCLTASIQFP